MKLYPHSYGARTHPRAYTSTYGTKITLTSVDPEATLLDFILEGKHVITIKALGTVANPHPLQERIAKLHDSQCGFCTPGIVMSLYALLRSSYDPVTRRYVLSEEMVELKGALEGNLCRCTGYKPILDAVKSIVREDLGGVVFEGKKSKVEGELGGNYISGTKDSGTGSCGRPGGCCKDTPTAAEKSSADESSSDETESSGETSITKTEECYELHTEITYPPALRKHTKQPIFYGNEKEVWFRPTTIEQLVELKHAYPSAKIVAGSSEVQVEVKFKHGKYGVLVYVGDIEGSKGFSTDEEKGEVVIGGKTSLTVLKKACLEGYKKLGKRGQLRYFAGRQIRNTATPAGNIVTASPISDLSPVFIASGAVLTAQSKTRGEFPLPMKEFFVAYRTTALPADCIITKLTIPLPAEGTREVIKSYKQAKGKDDDIAIVTARFRVVLDESSVVMDISLAYGGMAPKTVEAKSTMEAFLGKKWCDNTVLEDFPLGFIVPGVMPTYRKTLAFSFSFRFWHGVAAELELGTQEQQVDHEVIKEIHRGILYGSRDNDNPYEQRVVGNVGIREEEKAYPALPGLKQATRDAEYIDDMPNIEGQLFGGLVLSKKAHAKLVKVDFTPALQVPGMVGFVDINDLDDERNLWGSVEKGEPFFAKDFVHSHGQPTGMVYAESAAIAQGAAQLVDVQYEEFPPILTVSEAIAPKSIFPHGKMLICGKPTAEAFIDCNFVYEGVARMGGREHFYLEINAAAVIPRPEDEEMEVWSSTQNIMETQEFVSQVTGVPSSRIVAKVKRMWSAQLACILVVAAKKVGRPIRCMLNLDEDMMTSGQRNPFQAHWKVGVSKDGMLQVLDADVDNNARFSRSQSCYWTPHVHRRGHVCKTNTHFNTAFRGFGAPQGQYIAECIMTAINDHFNTSVGKLPWKNLCKEGQLTPFPQPLEDWHVPQIITQLKAESGYDSRVQQVEELSLTHKWKKRGISLIPTKFGLSFATAVHLNQAGALVHIYNDGSILLAHGGTETGQGLYTKMCQIAAQELNCSLDAIFTSETSSNNVANASPTAASAGSDLNGMALERVNLTANGYYKMPTIGYVWGNYVDPLPVYFYFMQGAAIPKSNWTHSPAHTDIKMDVLWQKNDELFTCGPGTYKIPGFADIPQVFNVGLLKGVKWAKLRSIQSSKGIGEPPLFLGASVLFTLREAVKAARESVAVDQEGLEVLQLDSPATSERMRVVVGDWIIRWAKLEAKEGEKGFLVEAMA
ncbi:xanthine dehydrogenase [Choiromyces venosus 120613-1]|uniref:Xanthine dehydrogenase n=1 Tax=Choiromyces venosus 120613-1 TaxID=1336337 RepID=A0A3N4J8C2_9PEZI|nr:xanthine dehydrogenase [Choiromyces venosus 120613-1]